MSNAAKQTTKAPKPTIKIRLAKKSEWETVWGIEKLNLLENWNLHPATTSPLDLDSADRLQRATLRRWFNPGKHKLLVATIDERIVGVAWYAIENHPLFQFLNGFLYSIVVLPEVRRQGVAERLMKAFIAASKKAGATWVRLNVLHANTRAQNLYRRFGFFDESNVMLARLTPSHPEQAKALARERKAKEKEAAAEAPAKRRKKTSAPE